MKGKIFTLSLILLLAVQSGYSQCMADAGTSTVINDGNGNFPFVLCFGDMFEILSNDDYVLPPATGGNIPGVMWGLYTCPPTEPVDPGLDACWDMSYWTGEDFINTNDGGIVGFLGGINTFWIAPIASDAVQLPNHDQDGDGCVDIGLGEIYQITLLDEITFNQQNIDNCNGEVTIEILGGYPEEFPGNPYTVVNTGGGTMMQSGVNGEIITITNLGNGAPYSIQVIEDGNGCMATFPGGTMNLNTEDPSFTFPPFCPSDPNAPTFVATPGGTFAFNPPPGDGATINPTTGEITGGVGGTTYFVEYTTGGACPTTGMPQPVTAVMLPPPPTVTPTNYVACQGDPIIVSPVGTGGNFNFYNDPGLISLVFSGPFFDPTSFVAVGVTTTFYVTETSGPCEGPPTSFDVLIESVNPPMLTPAAVTICQGDPVTISPTSTNANSTGTFNFYGNGALTNLLFTGAVYTFNPVMSTTIFVTEEISGCESTAVPFNITIDPEPAPPLVTSPVNICVNDPAPTLSATGTGGTINWYDTDPSVGNPFPIATGNPFFAPINTAIAGSTTYWVTETSAAMCEGAPAIIIVNVNAGPISPFAANPPAICVGDPAPVLTANGSGGTLTWYDSDPTVGAPIPIGIGSPFNPPVNTNIPGNTPYWVTETSAMGCEGTPTLITVMVNAAPAPPFANDPNTVCVGEPIPPIIANGSGGVLNWYGADPTIGNPPVIGMGSPFIPGVNNNFPATYDFWVTETNAGNCESLPAMITLTIAASPPPPIATDPNPICVGEMVPLLSATGSGGIINWYDSDPNLGNPFPLFSGNPFSPPVNNTIAGNTPFWVTEENIDGCESVPVLIIVTVSDDLPAPMATDPMAICVGDAIPDLTATGGAGTINWYDTDPTIGNPVAIGAGSPFSPPVNNNVAGNTQFWVTEVSASGCESNAAIITVSIENAPAAPNANTPAAICVDEPVPDVTATGSGGTLNWYDTDPSVGNPAPVGTGSPFSPTVNNAVAGNTSYWVTETNTTGCESAATEIMIIVNDNPTAPNANNPAAICVNEPVPDLTATGSGGTLNWYDSDPSVGNPASVGTGSPFTPVVNNTVAGTTSYWVTETNANNCEGPATEVIITVNSAPNALQSVSPSAICINEAIPNLTATGSGGTLNWYDSDPSIGNPAPIGSGSPFVPGINNMTAGTFDFWVSETNAEGCESTPTQVSITIEPNPQAPNATDPASICINEPVPDLTATGSGGTLNWYDSDPSVGNPAPVGTGSPFSPVVDNTMAGSTSFWVSETNATGCEGDATMVSIEVSQQPSAPLATSPSAICVGETIPNLTATGSGGTLNWYDSDPSVGNPASIGIGSPFSPVLDNMTAGTTSFWVSETSSSACEGPATEVTITINAAPTAPISTSPMAICIGTAIPDVTATGSGGTLNWYDSDPSVGNPVTVGTGSPFSPAVDNTMAGTFDFWVSETNAEGCEGEATQISITIDADPLAPNATDPASICINDLVPDLTATGNGGTLNWYDNDPSVGNPVSVGTGSPFSPAVDNTVAGTTSFWVSETNTTGCEGPATMVDVVVNALPSVMVETTCAADLLSYSVEVTTDADDVVATEGIVMDQGGGLFIIEGIDVNNAVDITIANTGTNCVSVLTVDPPDCNCPNVDAPISNGDEEICEGDDFPTLSVTVNANETVDWYDAPTGGILLLVGSNEYTPAAGGVYYAEARTLDNNCTSARTEVTLTINPFPSISSQELSCSPDLLSYAVDIIFADADQIMVSEGVVIDNGNGSFNISGIDINNDLMIVASNSVTMCSEEFVINPIPCNCPDIDAPISGGDVEICEGDDIPIISAMVGPDETVDWYDAPIGGTLLLMGNINFTPTEGGTYYAEARNTINNCISTRTEINLMVHPLPTIAMAETICAMDLLTYDLEVTFNDADDIAVSTGMLVDNGGGNFVITGITSGTDITITANNTMTGCMDIFMITAPDCNCPNVDAPVSGGDEVICEGELVPGLTATVGPNETVDWYDAAIGGTLLVMGSTNFNPPGAGIYYAETRTLVDDCLSSTRTAIELVINENPELVIVEETLPGCVTNNGSITLAVNSGTEPFQFSLDGGMTNQDSNIFDNLGAGAYDILVTDDNGCTGTINTMLNAPGGVTAVAGMPGTLTCVQETVTLNGSNSSGADDLIYEWILNGEIVSNEAVYITETAGTYTLRVISDDCEDTDEVIVDQNITDVMADIQNESNLNCVVTSLVLDGSNSTNNDDIEYQWLFNNAPIAGANNPTYEANMAGEYTLIVIDQSNGCRDSAFSTLLLDEAYPLALAGPDQQIDCDTDEVMLDGSGSQTGLSIVYQWFGPDGELIPDATQSTLETQNAGMYTLEVTDTLNGCFNTSTVFVNTDFTPPVASAGADQEINCDENSALLDGADSSIGDEFQYLWTVEGQGSIFSGAQTLMPVVGDEGKYALLVTNTNNGCTASDTTDVFEITEIATEFEIEVDDPACFGDIDGRFSIRPTDNSIPILYSLDGQTFSAANQFTNLMPGTYDLVAQDDRGCEWETTVTIQTPMELVVDLGEDQLINLGDSIQLNAIVNIAEDSIQTVNWTNESLLNCTDCLDPFTTQLKETNSFSIRVTDSSGCVAEDAITIFVSKERGVFIPNGFSPNNDGVNDLFMIFGGPDVVQVNSFRVFDRWGETLFEQVNFQPNNPNFGWDGTFRNSQPLNTSVFVYIAEIEFVDGEKLIFSGDVTLIR